MRRNVKNNVVECKSTFISYKLFSLNQSGRRYEAFDVKGGVIRRTRL